MRFRVLRALTHDGQRYQAGDPVELSPAQAAAMPWAVTQCEDRPAASPPASIPEPAQVPAREEQPDPIERWLIAKAEATENLEALGRMETVERQRTDGGRPDVLAAITDRRTALSASDE